MTKKDYILTLLTKLDGSREMAGPLKTLIQDTEVDDEFVDGLSALLMEAVHEVTDDETKLKLEASKKFIQKLQQQEANESRNIDSELDTMLANI